jgi:hypothetical protein
MSTVTDEMILAAVRAFNQIPGLFPAMKGALEAAEAVRAKAPASCGQDAMWQGIGAAMKRAAEQTLTMRVDSDPRVSQSAAVMTPAEKPTIPEGFIPWHGGECPVASGTVVKCMLVNEIINSPINAITMRWSRIGSSGDIIAYRIHKPADFRLEAGKYYIDAKGKRTRLVRGLTAPVPGLFHDGGARVWKADGTAQTAGDPDLLALSSNQENNHD